MSVVKASLLHGWNHEDVEDAKAEILEGLGDISGFEVWGTQCLVADYVRPTKTRGGILTTGSAQAEDIYQGKVGLLVVIGPDAFPEDSEDEARPPNGRRRTVGDWVYFSPQHAVQCSVAGIGSKLRPDGRGGNLREWKAGWPCRLVYARDLYGRVLLPQMLV